MQKSIKYDIISYITQKEKPFFIKIKMENIEQ